MKPYEVRRQLDNIRKDQSMWALFKCDDGKNESMRKALAWALQYDRRSEDEELIRYAFKEEVQWKAIDPYQGYDDTLNTLSFLLARYRKVEDAFFFEQAKYANFDTACGYDERFAFSAGLGKTWSYVSTFELDEGNPIFFEEKEAYDDLKEEEIESFLSELEDEYPKDFNQLSLKEQFDIAYELEDTETCERLFEELEKDTSEKDLFDMARYAGFYNKAAFYGEAVLKRADTLSRKMSLTQSLMQVYSEMGDSIIALEKAKEAYKYFMESHAHDNLTARRYFVERVFMASRSLAEAGYAEGAIAVFNVGDKVYRTHGNMTHHIAEIAYACCKLTQCVHLPYYESEYKRFKADTDAFMKRVLDAGREA